MQLAALELDLLSIRDLTKVDFAEAPLNFDAEFKAAKRNRCKTKTIVNKLPPMTWREFLVVSKEEREVIE